MAKWVVLASVLLAVGGGMMFVWPTAYVYGEVRVQGQEIPMRRNRLTGEVQVYDAFNTHTWRKFALQSE